MERMTRRTTSTANPPETDTAFSAIQLDGPVAAAEPSVPVNAIVAVPRTRPDRIAKAISLIFLPPVVAIVTLAILSLHFSDTTQEAVWAAVIASIFVSIIPVTYIAYLLRHSHLSGGYELTYQQERLRPYLFSAASSGLGNAALWWIGAPAPVVALTSCYGISAILLAVINRYWKISAHAAGAAMGVGAMVVAFGTPALPFAVILPAVCWARVRIHMHSTPQVCAGALFGTLSSFAPFAVFGIR